MNLSQWISEFIRSARLTWFLEKVAYSSVTYIVIFIEKILLFYCFVIISGKNRFCGSLLLFLHVDWFSCNETKPFHSCLEILTPCKLFQRVQFNRSKAFSEIKERALGSFEQGDFNFFICTLWGINLVD